MLNASPQIMLLPVAGLVRNGLHPWGGGYIRCCDEAQGPERLAADDRPKTGIKCSIVGSMRSCQ